MEWAQKLPGCHLRTPCKMSTRLQPFLLSKLRMSRALPVAQVTLTAVLTAWADRYDRILGETKHGPGPFAPVHLFVISLRPIWRGVNGPTCPLCLAGSSNHPIAGFGVAELLYFAAVAFLWYLVGRYLDRRRALLSLTTIRDSAREKVYALLTVTWGTLLLSFTILVTQNSFPATFGGGRIIRPEAVIGCALLLLWSLLLITWGTRKLLFILRYKRAQVNFPDRTREA